MRGIQALVGLAIGGAVIAALFDVSFPAGIVIAAGVTFVGGCVYGLFAGWRVLRRARRY